MVSLLLGIVKLGLWVGLWLSGGLWISRAAFRLTPGEELPVGFLIGMVCENLLTNLIAPLIPLPYGSWLSAGLVFVVGGIWTASKGLKNLVRFTVPLWQGLFVLFATGLFYAIGRGLAIFDDYAHLPTTSLMAAGAIPPHFALNPSIDYAYHYFLLLFSAQLMRVGGLPVWSALDLARALVFSITLISTFVWVQRLTFNKIAGVVGAAFLAFGMGTRWLLLLLPPVILSKISSAVHMLGSGTATGSTLVVAMQKFWAVDGQGPIPFPFAFVNGIFTPGVHNLLLPNSTLSIALTLTLLLTFNRWKNWGGALVTTILIASTFMVEETAITLFIAAWGILLLVEIIRVRSFRIPRLLWIWTGVLFVGSLLGLLQHGALTQTLANLFSSNSTQIEQGYQTIGFQLTWLPTIVSAHLGVLSLVNPRQLLVALAEIGPIVLMLPLVAIWGWRAYRNQRWYEAALILSGLLSISMAWVQFNGSTGVRNTSRLYFFIFICTLYAVPLTWRWVAHRSTRWKITLLSLAFITMFGGLAYFSVELFAIQKPLYSTFVDKIDAQVSKKFWNQLDKKFLIFDPNFYRGPTLFGLYTNSSLTWYTVSPGWQELVSQPDPFVLRAKNYGYMYLDEKYMAGISVESRQKLADPCIKVLKYIEEKTPIKRELLDIRACQK